MKITSSTCIVDRHPFEQQAHCFVVPTDVLSVVENVSPPQGANLAVLSSEDIEPFITEVGVVGSEGTSALRRVISDSMGCCALYAITANTAKDLRDGRKSVLEISAAGFIEPNGMLSSTSRNIRNTAGAINSALAKERENLAKERENRLRIELGIKLHPEVSDMLNISRENIALELTGYEIQAINYARVAPAELLRTAPIFVKREAAIRAGRVFPVKSSRAGG